MRRREFLTISSGTLGGVLIYGLDRKASLLGAQGKAKDKALRIPLRFFRENEALIVAAAVARIFPSDESGPGAKEAGVAIYVDRQLAGPYGRDAHRYTQGPFEEDAAPEFGYQGKATPREIYREGLKELAGFLRVSAAEQDDALRKIEGSTFFSLLRQHTIEGMFSDPLHGGNVDMVGWQLVGFPGPRMNNADDIDKHYGEAFRPKMARLREVVGREVRGSEGAK
jgi:gluconate 2-dehydrogenase gamma chain